MVVPDRVYSDLQQQLECNTMTRLEFLGSAVNAGGA